MKRKIEVGVVREFDYYQVILPVKIKYPKDYKRYIFKDNRFFNDELSKEEIEQLLELYSKCEITEVSVFLTLFDYNYSVIPGLMKAKWLTDKLLRHALSWWTPTSTTFSSWFDLNSEGKLVCIDNENYSGFTCEQREIMIEETEILKIHNNRLDLLSSDYLIAGLYQKSVRE